MNLQRLFELWVQLVWWEKQLLLWFARLALSERALLPVISWQALAMGVVMLVEPDHVLLWSLVFIVSLVYALMLRVVLRR